MCGAGARYSAAPARKTAKNDEKADRSKNAPVRGGSNTDRQIPPLFEGLSVFCL